MPDKRFLINWLVTFVTMMMVGFVIFGVLMVDVFLANPSDMVFRAEGAEKMEWVAIANLIMAFVFVKAFTQGYENKGMGEGLRFGLLFGAFLGATEMLAYAFMPGSYTVMWVSVGGDLAFMAIVGMILSKVYPMTAPKA